MSEFKIEIVEIDEILPIPSAERLEIALVRGWQVVVGKGEFFVGSPAIYLPVDCVLGHSVESILFPPDAKVKLHNSRIKTIKLRGAISQGMLIKPHVLDMGSYEIGDDITELLDIKKYEPPVRTGNFGQSHQTSKKQCNPNFRKYTEIENLKNYPKLFIDGEDVIISEKLHGSNWRFGYVPFYADTLWKKVKKFFGIAPNYEMVYGSHNVQLQDKFLYKGYYDKNIYSEMIQKYDIKDKIDPGVVLYGEVIGSGIQKNYMYGCTDGERKLVIFDVMINNKYLDQLQALEYCEFRGLSFVPILYVGPFNIEKAKELTIGNSVYAPEQKIREGVVIKPIQESSSYVGRKVLKLISDDYLLQKDLTDYH